MCQLEGVNKQEWDEHCELVRSVKAWLKILGFFSTFIMLVLGWFVKKALDVPDKNGDRITAVEAEHSHLEDRVLLHWSDDSHMPASEKISTFVSRGELSKDMSHVQRQLDVQNDRSIRMETKLDRLIEAQLK